MRKTICILLILSLVLGLCLVLVGCNSENNKEVKTYKVTIWELSSRGNIYNGTNKDFYVEENKPIGNTFKYQNKDAYEYVFYIDKYYSIEWNLLTDPVNCDMVLFASKGI